MATATATPPSAPAPKVNRIGLPVIDYRGGKTTLCAGCGHNAISERIIDAMFEMGVQPERLMKLSGIGCSSKSPAYFMSRSHSFNSVHGRMPSVSTGAILGNHTMLALGVSGDGDTASIGMGQFVHLLRRNLPMIYIIEQNRDAQMLSLLKLDLPAAEVVKLRSIRHYGGLPIDARSITDDLTTQEGI